MPYHKCDKCKKEFDPTDYRAGTIYMVVYDSNDPGWPAGKLIELCPDCMKLIRKLIMEALKHDD